jgi:fructose transport system ATP-binding protein
MIETPVVIAPVREPILRATGITKVYGAVQALAGIDFELYAGEVLGIVGDNGAGKSTFIKILSGAIAPDAGSIFVDGGAVHFRGPLDARRAGIETVFQELAVIPLMDVEENFFLGRELCAPGPLGLLKFLRKTNMRDQAREEIASLRVGIPSVRQRVGTLSGGQRQSVAVARAVAWSRKIVIMDEPTAALGVKESRGVQDLIKRVRDRGIAVILISHNMPQVFDVTDRIFVLRHGAHVGTVNTIDTTMDQVIKLITGATLHEHHGRDTPAA